MQKLFVITTAFILSVLRVTTGLAAEITVQRAKTDQDATKIFISGLIETDDENAFKKISFDIDHATVFLEGTGGLTFPALAIGRLIRYKGFSTAVVDASCLSSCALVWLAGQPRVMTPKARIGFHAAYSDTDKQMTGPANALIGAYLSQLGLRDEAIIFMTTAGPDEISRLTRAEGIKFGLQIETYIDQAVATDLHNQAVQLRTDSADDVKAATLYRRAADLGLAGSQNNLGDLYEKGAGVRLSDKFAIYWYSRAAERGEPTAYLSLSTALSRDSTDVEVLVEAMKYAVLASKLLGEGRNKTAATETLATIAAKLSPEQRARARQLADAWTPLYQEPNFMSDKPR